MNKMTITTKGLLLMKVLVTLAIVSSCTKNRVAELPDDSYRQAEHAFAFGSYVVLVRRSCNGVAARCHELAEKERFFRNPSIAFLEAFDRPAAGDDLVQQIHVF